MLGRRGRLSFRFMRKRNRLLFEAGVGILLIIVFFGALNAVVTTHRTPVLTTQDLWEHANTTIIAFQFVNSSDTTKSVYPAYKLADIASYYNGYLYITIPYPDTVYMLRTISIFNLTDSNGEQVTGQYIVSHGINSIYVYMEPIADADKVVFYNTFKVGPLTLALDSSGNGNIWPWEDTSLADIVTASTANDDNGSIKWNALWPDDNHTAVDRTIEPDLGSIAIKIAGNGGNIVGITRFMGDIQGLDGVKLKLEMYAVSKKPLLAGLTEPIAGIFSSMYAAILAAFRRVKNYAATMFGGWLSGFTFTGLIGDPMTALVVSVVIITVVYWIHKR